MARRRGDLPAEAFGLDPAGGGGEIVEGFEGAAGDGVFEAVTEAGLVEGEVGRPGAGGEEPGGGGFPVFGEAPDAELAEGDGAVRGRVGVGSFPKVGRARGEPVDEGAELARALGVGGIGVHVGQIGVEMQGAEHGGVVDDEAGGIGLAGDGNPAAETLAVIGVGGDVEAPAFVDDGASDERGVVGVANGGAAEHGCDVVVEPVGEVFVGQLGVAPAGGFVPDQETHAVGEGEVAGIGELDVAADEVEAGVPRHAEAAGEDVVARVGVTGAGAVVLVECAAEVEGLAVEAEFVFVGFDAAEAGGEAVGVGEGVGIEGDLDVVEVGRAGGPELDLGPVVEDLKAGG